MDAKLVVAPLTALRGRLCIRDFRRYRTIPGHRHLGRGSPVRDERYRRRVIGALLFLGARFEARRMERSPPGDRGWATRRRAGALWDTVHSERGDWYASTASMSTGGAHGPHTDVLTPDGCCFLLRAGPRPFSTPSSGRCSSPGGWTARRRAAQPGAASPRGRSESRRCQVSAPGPSSRSTSSARMVVPQWAQRSSTWLISPQARWR